MARYNHGPHGCWKSPLCQPLSDHASRLVPRRLLFCLTLTSVALASTLSFAQTPLSEGESYAPQMAPMGELLVTTQFSRSPLNFPWERVSAREVGRDGRIDFEHVYDIPFSEVRTFVESAYLQRTEFVEVDPDAVPHTEVKQLRVIGMELGQSYARLNLGHPDVAPQFSVEMEADGRRTRVLIRNSTSNPFYSGFTPARAPFEPAGAAPINFRWN